MLSWLIPSTPFETWLLAMIFVVGNVIALRLMTVLCVQYIVAAWLYARWTGEVNQRGRHLLQMVSATGGGFRSIVNGDVSVDDAHFTKDGKTLYVIESGAAPSGPRITIVNAPKYVPRVSGSAILVSDVEM